ncbi:unnamed protein product [Oppiella nova]|uniref:CUB domain-containing protein n=1 Tax=Oppiella nova TaxID=334625 RepID=A0A7R9QAV2_9ACAR|nr:unnamed protein product [Oppiella nova]CAG2162075.1 unnamed protein product [Oppiella nova]
MNRHQTFNLYRCNGTYTGDSGEINVSVTPNITEFKIEVCQWHVVVGPKMSIQLTIDKIIAQTIVDTLYIYDGNSETDTKLKHLTNFADDDYDEIVSTTNQVLIQLTMHKRSWFPINNPRTIQIRYKAIPSDCNKTYTGDSGDISLVRQLTEQTKTLTCHWTISVATNMRCGLELTERQGIIYSPGYPIAYYHKMNCEWKIRVPKNHTIILQFIDFKTEDTDHLTISDYTISGYSGHQLPPNLYSASNALTLIFKTDMSVTDRGFKIAYKAKELDPYVTFLASAYNVLIKLNSSDVKTIAMNGDIMSGLMDYNIKDDRIVWFDPQKHKFILKSIQSTVDMSDEIDVVGQPNSLLLDWVHDLLYWIDIKSKTIKVLHFKDTESVYTMLFME